MRKSDVMQNKRIGNTINRGKTSIIRTHIENNLRHYIIVTVIFLIRSCGWCAIYK